jgi:uncharacterized protein YjbJ (UPF0337 family)
MWLSADVRNIFFVVASVRAECGMTSAVFHGPATSTALSATCTDLLTDNSLINRKQQVYGHAKDQVKKDVDEWVTTLKGVMNWDHIEGDWKRFSGAIKEKWDKLTEEEIAELKGKREQLEAKIQQVYGHARDQVKKDVDEWVRELARRI